MFNMYSPEKSRKMTPELKTRLLNRSSSPVLPEDRFRKNRSLIKLLGESNLWNTNEPDVHQQHLVPHSMSYDNIKPNKTLKHSHTTHLDNIWQHATPQYESNDLFEQMCRSKFNQQASVHQNPYSKSLKATSQLPMPANEPANIATGSSKDQIILHVTNLDYKISSDEWTRILLENFRKHCKEVLSVNVILNPDRSLLGIVRLCTKDDARLAISCLHHKKIGYKRLSVSIASAMSTNSPKSKIIALLKTNETNEMTLSKFLELFELRYAESITVAELFNLRDIVHIVESRDGKGRQIKLTGRNLQNNLENEMQEMLHISYCSLHSDNQDPLTTSKWLPSVVISLRTFKSAVHKLLNDHGGQMPLLSFMDCYKACIFNETAVAGRETLRDITQSQSTLQGHASAKTRPSSSNPMKIDNLNGIPLEHLITCAQDVQIQYNEGCYKQLQWENDKSKPANLQSRQPTTRKRSMEMNLSRMLLNDKFDLYGNRSLLGMESDQDESATEESQRKLNQFSHDVVELFKGMPRCTILLSKFNNEYNKKYGRQCRVSDYGYTKIYDLLNSIPHILQILDGEFEKKLTLTHHVQVRRFSNDLLKVLKSHSTRQMFADEYPTAYERHINKPFDIRDYGVCFLEDMLAELPDSIINRKEIDGRTFIHIPKVVQHEYDRLCTDRLHDEIVDMLKQKPRFAITFNKFIPDFHHHFGRQCKLSNYGFTKLIELIEAMPNSVQVITKNEEQYIQLHKNTMLHLICQNLIKLTEESPNAYLRMSLMQLEEIYNAKCEPICYKDFECANFNELCQILPFNLNTLWCKFEKDQFGLDSIRLKVDLINEKELRRTCRTFLSKIMKDCTEERVMRYVAANKEQGLKLEQVYEIVMQTTIDLTKRSWNFMLKYIANYFILNETDPFNVTIKGLSELYLFAKHIRNFFITSNRVEFSFTDLGLLYRKNQNWTSSVSLSHPKQSFMSINFPHRRLGFVDTTQMFSHGLNALGTVKKFNVKRFGLNKEFWSESMHSVHLLSLTEKKFCPQKSLLAPEFKPGCQYVMNSTSAYGERIPDQNTYQENYYPN